jgi:hypothetical protein
MIVTIDKISMILTIPYQAFEIGNIHLTPFQLDRYGKTIARLAYKDTALDFHDVSILSPPLTILDYNSDTSRLRLDLSDHYNFQVKINTLHEYLISTFFIHQQTLLNRVDVPYEEIRRLFYFLLDGCTLSLFIYPTVVVKKENGVHCRVCDLKKGDVIRCAIRIQGISQIINKDELRLRLHHSVPSIWFIAASTLIPLQTLGSSSIILHPPTSQTYAQSFAQSIMKYPI